MLLKCGKGKQTYQIYHNKLRRWAKAVTYMVNGNSYPLSSVLWIIAAENDSCRPRRGRVVATSEGETARPIRWPPLGRLLRDIVPLEGERAASLSKS